ncbi:WXG100 family type VII secretion target [Mangrovihabitans endophyticus]|uniref:WXG100 family type VII secretion target n=1 Tax=Mangrovihabitans endophyticus TaxID=1751298 RepID=UPI001E4DEA15|nr:WXG100 family type VII secretion target [Mangrovihabitans endophyticus]
MWLAEDIQVIVHGVRNGNWIEASLGGVAGSLDALAFVSDPVGSLLQYAVAWIIEHVRPLSQALDWLAGDPAQIAAHAQTWRNVASSLRDQADDWDRAVRSDTSEWTGIAADAYRKWAGRQNGAVAGMAEAAGAMAAITETAGMLVAGVRMLVRDAIAVLVSRLITYAGEALFSLGLATPVVVEQVSTLCAAWSARISRWLRDLISSLVRLRGMADNLAGRIDALRGLFRRTARGEAGPARVHGGHADRPRDIVDYERQERWANDAYDDIRMNPDADVIAGNLGDVARLDGSTGFTAAEIDRIRQHIFFEEHPVSDYAGGIVHQRYDASPDMADAWLRLRSGRARPEDIALLEHELAEARYYDAHPGATYEEAHRAANEVSNWQNQIPEPTYEDYSAPWR